MSISKGTSMCLAALVDYLSTIVVLPVRISRVLSFAFPLVYSIRVLAQVPTPAHVVIVIEENHNYSSIIGSLAAPYINALVADSNAALFTQSFGLTHPSQPNYLMLFSGSNQGVLNDNLPTGLPFSTANLGGSLLNAGRTFAGYSEDLPSVGYNGTTSGAYARKHNPWANWQSSPTNGIPTTANLPLTYFPAHYDSLPVVSFVIPNQNNDMHNGSDPATITTGDTWLQNHLDNYIRWAKTHNSLFILTFDEGTTSGTNQIVTLFIGPMVRHGQYNEIVNHYSILRTIEDMYALPYAGGSATATPIADCWVVRASVTALLEGSYNSSSLLMEHSGILAGHFSVFPSQAVDSISIELRNVAVNPTTRKFRPAWLLVDGSIRSFTDTTKPYVEFDTTAGNYYLVVHHRIHLSIMTSFSVTLNSNVSVYDFTTSLSQAYGTNAMKALAGGKFGLYAGDANQSGMITAADANSVFGSLNAAGYLLNDVNLSGIVSAADANMVFGNLNVASQVP